jgi:Predicted Fe-S oxidoreductases
VILPKIYLEITNVCNLRCRFCPETKRVPEFMRVTDFELYLEKLAPFGDHLYFHVKGEPLLHPELGDFLAIAAGRGFAVSITTNGVLLAERAAMILGAANIRKLSVSLHSHSGAADVEEYWRGVADFLDRHRITRPFPISLRLWNRRSGSLPPETERLWELVRERYPSATIWENAAVGDRAQKLDEKVFVNQDAEFAWPDASAAANALRDTDSAEEGREHEPAQGGALARGFCRALRNQVAVLVDGTVVPCCLDGEGAMALGNLRESGLRLILDSPRARAIYDGFSRREIVEPLCASCGYRSRFDR